MDGMTIGTLARKAGVGVETIRFYERKGFLVPGTAGGGAGGHGAPGHGRPHGDGHCRGPGRRGRFRGRDRVAPSHSGLGGVGFIGGGRRWIRGISEGGRPGSTGHPGQALAF